MNEERIKRVFTSFTEYDPEPVTPSQEKELLQTTSEADAWAIIGHMKYLTPETWDTLQKRSAEFRELYPDGLPMPKAKDGYQYHLYSIDIADILGISLRKAQKMLQITRIALRKSKTAHICVKEFCFVNELDEAEFRKSLADLGKDTKKK